MVQFFCSSPFSNIQKSILTNLKIPGTVFLLIPFFSNIKKSILTNLKTPVFMVIIILLKETIYIKTIIQISKHKVKYIITACIPKLLQKKIYFL